MVEGFGYIGVLGPQNLFPDRQGSLVKELGFSITSTAKHVRGSVVK